jgi:hypothetical protein
MTRSLSSGVIDTWSAGRLKGGRGQDCPPQETEFVSFSLTAEFRAGFSGLGHTYGGKMTPKTAKVTFAPQNQNLETVNALVANILNKAGCRMCGRLLNLDFQFQGDPAPDLAKLGAIDVQTVGF